MKLFGFITAKQTLKAKLTPKKSTLFGTISAGKTANNSVYVGDYEVTSDPERDFKLQTKSKLLTDDITVKAIPYFETSNTADGLTVYIGKEVELSYGN